MCDDSVGQRRLFSFLKRNPSLHFLMIQVLIVSPPLMVILNLSWSLDPLKIGENRGSSPQENTQNPTPF